MKDLFTLVVPEDQLHPSFSAVRKSEGHVGARHLMNAAFADMKDPDGNFLQQFQTDGFDARFFELYLQALFQEQGFEIDRPTPNPDFIIETCWDRVAIEATTSGAPRAEEKEPIHSEQAAVEWFTTRIGSPLYSKLQKRYWEKPNCRELPLILAIEAFHGADSLMYSESAISRYLYGVDFVNPVITPGKLEATMVTLKDHHGHKVIPSAFFSQPHAENISAVLFTNQGTLSKFTRMAFQQGHAPPGLVVERRGVAFDPNGEAMDPIAFAYQMTDPLFVEHWSSGVWLFHNPNALRPLREDLFKDGVNQSQMVDGELRHMSARDRVLSSTTHSFWAKSPRTKPPVLIQALPMAYAAQLQLEVPDGWALETVFASNSGRTFGALIRKDGVWSYQMHTRADATFDDRATAGRTLQIAMLSHEWK